jgi:hypothetical protein
VSPPFDRYNIRDYGNLKAYYPDLFREKIGRSDECRSSTKDLSRPPGMFIDEFGKFPSVKNHQNGKADNRAQPGCEIGKYHAFTAIHLYHRDVAFEAFGQYRECDICKPPSPIQTRRRAFDLKSIAFKKIRKYLALSRDVSGIPANEMADHAYPRFCLISPHLDSLTGPEPFALLSEMLV